MLHFSSPLTPIATKMILYCLEISAALSAKCLTRERAREVLLALLDKLRLPQHDVFTTYHWLLMYEYLHLHIECLNDDPWPELIDR